MLHEALANLRAAIAELEVQVPESLQDSSDVASALMLLAVLRESRRELHRVEDFAEGRAAHLMADDTFQAVGLTARRRQTAERTDWDHSGLATAVLASAMVDENGELPSEEANLVGCRVKDALMACAGIAYWRVGKLGQRKIAVSDYRKRTPGRWTVEVDLADEAAA